MLGQKWSEPLTETEGEGAVSLIVCVWGCEKMLSVRMKGMNEGAKVAERQSGTAVSSRHRCVFMSSSSRSLYLHALSGKGALEWQIILYVVFMPGGVESMSR